MNYLRNVLPPVTRRATNAHTPTFRLRTCERNERTTTTPLHTFEEEGKGEERGLSATLRAHGGKKGGGWEGRKPPQPQQPPNDSSTVGCCFGPQVCGIVSQSVSGRKCPEKRGKEEGRKAGQGVIATQHETQERQAVAHSNHIVKGTTKRAILFVFAIIKLDNTPHVDFNMQHFNHHRHHYQAVNPSMAFLAPSSSLAM